MRQPLTIEQIRSAPKVLLHDHLDGGPRPATVIELARETGYRSRPSYDEAALAEWFTTGAARHDLALYLEPLTHTVGAAQTTAALIRRARGGRHGLAA